LIFLLFPKTVQIILFGTIHDSGGREIIWQKIKVGKTETLESALRRFKTAVPRSGILAETESGNTMKSPAKNGRRKLRQRANVSLSKDKDNKKK
jgi:ribosomal protein S21